MKRWLGWLMALLLLITAAAAPAAAENAFDEEEIDIDELLKIEEDLLWSFPVALEEMNPEYIVLANKHYLLDKDYVPADLVKVPKDPAKGGIKWAGSSSDGKLTGWYLREECAQALCEMNAAMREVQGFRTMYLKSAYRSWSKQNTMYKNRLKKNNGKDDGWVSMAGASDHQTGLGCDVVPSNWTDRGMNEKMMKEPECQWMAEHCQEYGFIIRYPADKKEFTEINTEPWHLRYVGIPAATYIMENGLCLEEFHEQLQAAISEYLAKGGDPERVEGFVQKSTD
ncbi:MAG: M15 family metallopeptidase [Clostridia bacterium]|nr:M15 family metallopeptidase [Clostridia bacterium]